LFNLLTQGKNVKIGRKLLLGFFFVIALVVAVGVFSLIQLYRIKGPLTEDVPAMIDELSETSHLDSLAQFIRYYDEVLTQSVRNYAFTQDKKWRQRYEDIEPRLELMIKSAVEKGDETDREIFSTVDKANKILVEMEYRVIDFVDDGQVIEAIEILESHDYWDRKELYEQALRNYVSRRGAKYNEAFLASTKLLDWTTSRTVSLIDTSVFFVAVFVLVALVAAVAVSMVVSYSVSRPIVKLKTAAAKLAKEKLKSADKTQTGDEIEQMVRFFGDIAEQLELAEDITRGRPLQSSTPDGGLKAEMARHSHTEDAMQKRIKELNCLYGLSKLIEQPNIKLEQIFQKAVTQIRNAYQSPEKICVRITFDGIHYKSDNFDKTEVSQYTEINVGRKKAGTIEVYYLGQHSGTGEQFFLKEEKELLDAVARRLGDAAERIQATQNLQLFRDLLDRSNDFIFVIEPKWGRFLDMNDRTCSSLGYSRDELLEMSVKDIDSTIQSDAAWSQLAEQVSGAKQMVLEGLYRRKDGGTFPVEINVRFMDFEEGSFMVAVARDITERKKAQEKQAQLLNEVKAANKELKDFAHIVSHDLKAPLRGIKSLVDWITADYADKLDEDGKQQMSLLVSRVERMRNLIDGVLQYSRVGRAKEQKTRVELNKLVNEVIDMLLPAENIEITVENQLPVVECEKTRIMQVFQNLISNAIKYMDKPQGRIRISSADEGGFWRLSIADNGPGIEEQYFEKIFQIFQTLSARDEFESTGVGLSVVKKVVEMYGGRIWVESKVGQGSTFHFTLPKIETVVENKKLEAAATA